MRRRIGLPRNAFGRYERAADAGDQNAACEVVKCLATGRGVDKNISEAYRFYEAASELQTVVDIAEELWDADNGAHRNRRKKIPIVI